jgi:uncharacterized protein YndB with AHSA1/START domain
MADTTETTGHAIDREIVIEAPVEVVWRTITEPDQIARWFADRVELDLRPGGQGTFDFRSRATTRPATVPLQVEVVDPPHRFAFRWVLPEGGAPGPGNSVLVDFTLTAERTGDSDGDDGGGERTRLRVTETGVADLPWSDDDKAGYVEEHVHGWQVHLGDLANLLAAPAG